jgi:hypothetical protein
MLSDAPCSCHQENITVLYFFQLGLIKKDLVTLMRADVRNISAFGAAWL